MTTNEQKLYYAAWWRRFLAFTIDGFIVLMPIMILQYQITKIAPRLMAVLLIPFSVLYSGYYIFCHGRWGKTLGKHITGTRVTSLDGSLITWRQAFLRDSVNIALTIPFWYAFIPAYLTVPLDNYYQATFLERYKLINALLPGWYAGVDLLNQCWIWSEFIVILMNRRRRALHDFIAGTIVIQKKPTRRQAKEDDPYNIDWERERKRLQNI